MVQHLSCLFNVTSKEKTEAAASEMYFLSSEKEQERGRRNYQQLLLKTSLNARSRKKVLYIMRRALTRFSVLKDKYE